MTMTLRRPVSPDDLLRIRFITDPQISPDGARVAFVVTTLSETTDEYLSNIWVVETSGGEPRRFTTGPTRDTAPRWSPDGRRLAFVSEREPSKKPQLFVMPSEGGEPVRLTDVKHGIHGLGGAVWAPDGTRLTFTSRVGGQGPEGGDGQSKSRPARVITTLKHKFEGEGFTKDRPARVSGVESAAGASPPIAAGDYPHAWPAWAPDGQNIAFVSERHETRDDNWASDVWLIAASGGEPRRLTDTTGPTWYPVFSPDGALVAYAGHPYPKDDGRNARMYVAPIDGGAPVCLTEVLDRPVWDMARPVWSADGQDVLFIVRDRGDYPVYRVRAKGGEAPSLFVGGHRTVTGLSVARDNGRVAFTATDPLSPAEVFVCNADGSDERRLTDLNGAWRAEVALSPPERFRYQRDGFEIDGWIIRPVGFDPARRVPALLWIHGGPHREFGDYYSHEFQVYAAAGYAVVYTNPRGSHGYGEAFSRAVVGDWGGGDFADIMAGLDEALRRCSFIDPERLGVIGISYGGYMTSWAVTHTNRFRAACSEGAINHVHAHFGNSDIRHVWAASEQAAPPWEDMRSYLERSPLTHVTHVDTPLLIIHAENDLRCPIDQAEQMFTALKRLGKEVVFIRFPGEGHTFATVGTPRHRLQRYRHILEWFEKHLHPEAR